VVTCVEHRIAAPPIRFPDLTTVLALGRGPTKNLRPLPGRRLAQWSSGSARSAEVRIAHSRELDTSAVDSDLLPPRWMANPVGCRAR
jgi:hypothetical protein